MLVVSGRLGSAITYVVRGLVQLGMNIAIGNRLRYTVERSKDGLQVASCLHTHITAAVQSIANLHP